MGILHISPDEHLKRVMGNPSDLILKQRELSEATYPLLVSYLGWLRRLNAIQNKNDVIHQNEQIFKEFVHVCEHNLLFFLTVSGRFDIIRELFKDKHLLTKEIALLEEIEKECAQAAAANIQKFLFIPPKKQSSTLQSEAPKPPHLPTSEWEKSLYGITNMSLYQYYEEEMERITHIHHVKQIKLIDTSYEEHIVLMQKALNLISQDEYICEETKQKAITLYNTLITMKNEMELEYAQVDPLDGVSSELELMEQQYQVKQGKLKEAQEAFDAFFEEVRHESPQLQMIYEEHHEIVKNFEKESQAIKAEWQREKETLSTQYENARAHALDDIDSGLSLIIDELKKCPADDLDEKQISKLDASLLRLHEYKVKLRTVERYESTQILLSACNKDLETIASIIKPILSDEAKKCFDLNVYFLKQMFVAPQDSIDTMIPTSHNSLQETVDRGSESSKSNVPEPKELVIKGKSSMPTDELAEAKQLQPEGERIEPIHLPEKQNNEAELDKPVIKLKSTEQHESVSSKKSAQVERYGFFVSAVSDGTELIEFDSEKQRNYESALKELSSVLSDLNEEVEPKIAEKIGKIETLIKDAKSMGFDKASPTHIQKICDACDLGIDYDPLNHVKDSLASMLHSQNKHQKSVGM